MTKFTIFQSYLMNFDSKETISLKKTTVRIKLFQVLVTFAPLQQILTKSAASNMINFQSKSKLLGRKLLFSSKFMKKYSK